jgi:hypothetical protein
MMNVIIDEMKDVLYSQLQELLQSKKQLELAQVYTGDLENHINYYRESYRKISDNHSRYIAIKDDLNPRDVLLFHFNEERQ